MGDITLWAETVDWLEIIYNVLAGLVIPLVVAAIGLRSVASIYRFIVALRFAFDETTDPVVEWFALRLGKTPEETLEIINRLLQIIEEGSVVDEDAIAEQTADKLATRLGIDE